MTEASHNSTRPSGDGLEQILLETMRVTERLQRTHETLQHEVERLRKELASKDQELERRRRLAALGELAAGVAHEVRNPLGAIQLYSGLLRRECASLGAAEALIEKIEAGIRAIDGVVQDTLALAPRSTRLQARRVADVVRRAADVCAAALAGRETSLRVQLADEELHVLADEGGLQRVIVNLVVNAAEATPPGGAVELACARADDQQVELAVRDRGCGLPEELLERIFDPFFTTKDHGTGLGLTIALRLVEAYGGALRARNRDGGGAEFCVRLPAADPRAFAAEPQERTTTTSVA
jgi:signal transduction histidine kinase